MLEHQWIFCFAIATILAVIKLVMEYQYTKDRNMGIAHDKKDYTIMGMIRLIRGEKREQKKRECHSDDVGETKKEVSLSVKRFNTP